MRKIINSTYISLDGRVENPHLWPSTGDSDPRFNQIQTDLLMSCDAVLMGRRTYDGFAPVWPTRSGDPVSDRMNSIRKYVVSDSLTDPEWTNCEVLNGDVVTQLADLKAQPGQDIVQYGIGAVTRLLTDNGLLDVLRLWVHPVIAGGSDYVDFVTDGLRPSTMRLRESTTLTNGIIVATYDHES